MSRKPKDLTAKRFGRVVVIKRNGYIYKSNVIAWLCRCDCGTTKTISGYSLIHQGTKSCGCLQKEIFGKMARERITHGKTNHPLFKMWCDMKSRCKKTPKPSKNRKKYYIDRGITVCEEWQKFEVFYKWAIGNGWEKGLEIDRRNTKKGYNPVNCRIVTHKENTQNSSHSKRWYINGKKYRSLRDAAEGEGISTSTIFNKCHGQKEGCRTENIY